MFVQSPCTLMVAVFYFVEKRNFSILYRNKIKVEGGMRKVDRMQPIEAANEFVNKYFSHCQGAILAGSVVRGEATETSDLDIIIFDRAVPSSYRESLVDFEWPIELFVHNLTSYKEYFQKDCERARPSLPRMVAEGMIVRGEEIISPIKQKAREILDKGPAEWPVEIIQMKRYFLTDALDDFRGSSNRAEELFIANTLAELASEFVLRTNRQWIGASKWVVRALKQYNEPYAHQFVNAFNLFYQTGEKKEVIQLVEEILQPFGGRLFDGFAVGKDKD